MPKTNPDFWRAKFSRNIQRDMEVCHALRGLGWRIEIIWECEAKSDDQIRSRLLKIFGFALTE